MEMLEPKQNHYLPAEEEVKRYKVTSLAFTEDLLGWWKSHEQVYPFLAILAKRLLFHRQKKNWFRMHFTGCCSNYARDKQRLWISNFVLEYNPPVNYMLYNNVVSIGKCISDSVGCKGLDNLVSLHGFPVYIIGC